MAGQNETDKLVAVGIVVAGMVSGGLVRMVLRLSAAVAPRRLVVVIACFWMPSVDMMDTEFSVG